MILPWNDKTVAASPFVAAFTKMGIPYADHIMNAVVLTAVLSCLNSGMYTASRMLFVLAARREAPLQLVKVTRAACRPSRSWRRRSSASCASSPPRSRRTPSSRSC